MPDGERFVFGENPEVVSKIERIADARGLARPSLSLRVHRARPVEHYVVAA